MDISLIVAYGKNREIGKDNQLLWHISEDLKNFKRLTVGHTLIMGRKTFESIGRALPKRQTVVLTRNHEFSALDILTAHSVEQAIELAKQSSKFNQDELFIAGGGEIYRLFLPLATKLYLSSVDMEVEGADTYFPEIDLSEWALEKQETISSSPVVEFSVWKQ
jgi:dihydrofolate reductase